MYSKFGVLISRLLLYWSGTQNDWPVCGLRTKMSLTPPIERLYWEMQETFLLQHLWMLLDLLCNTTECMLKAVTQTQEHKTRKIHENTFKNDSVLCQMISSRFKLSGLHQ